ncbi:hypothetical protein WR25_22394 [Diploscapter pachys]|uniref:NR LBD domain-containing protein n=1 Tax=Diploscapter pachys TaxID=2018661 RepID=A0A2A2JJJ8_9BILA|nr:hypothetical protein WR25_22394 [Diploscapter pachys]
MAPPCAACAAFYRRTVSMNMHYKCSGSGAGCKIHYELRMICRKCRFEKCVLAGMRRELVQSKHADKHTHKSNAQSDLLPQGPPIKRERRDTPETIIHKTEVIRLPTIKEVTSSSFSSTSGILKPLDLTPSMYQGCNQITVIQNGPLYVNSYNSGFRSAEITTGDSNATTDFNTITIDPCTSVTPDSLINESANIRTMDVYNEEVSDVLSHYVRMEASLNDRRKIMFTDVSIGQVFHKLNECNLMFRMAVAVDCMINSAYYTYRLGLSEKLLVLWNAEYICMSPLPLSGEEPEAEQIFTNKDDFTKYKSLMPTKLRQWLHMAVPFSELHVTFEEFALLKAMTIWQISYYKLSENGRQICDRQRQLITLAMHRLCVERGEDPAVRVGQLLLSMSYIIEQVNHLTSSFLMLTVFDIVNYDPVTKEILNFRYDEV